ncbi:unnamed protein product [Paramecium sonneborni]|uniref:Uncharacterized protein n=1 Tax=Paramecium sonneborni TaxID=65129 RepID=A0A8S1RL89_9CILI|nr:unnamed protein product [Paramecium sonneborni]
MILIQIGYKITILQVSILVLQILLQQTLQSIYIVNMREIIDSELGGLLFMINEYKLSCHRTNRYLIISNTQFNIIDLFHTYQYRFCLYSLCLRKIRNVKSIGFQLILGIDEVFAQPQTIFSNQNYDSQVYDSNQPDRVEDLPRAMFSIEFTADSDVYTSKQIFINLTLHNFFVFYQESYQNEIFIQSFY